MTTQLTPEQEKWVIDQAKECYPEYISLGIDRNEKDRAVFADGLRHALSQPQIGEEREEATVTTRNSLTEQQISEVLQEFEDKNVVVFSRNSERSNLVKSVLAAALQPSTTAAQGEVCPVCGDLNFINCSPPCKLHPSPAPEQPAEDKKEDVLKKIQQIISDEIGWSSTIPPSIRMDLAIRLNKEFQSQLADRDRKIEELERQLGGSRERQKMLANGSNQTVLQNDELRATIASLQQQIQSLQQGRRGEIEKAIDHMFFHMDIQLQSGTKYTQWQEGKAAYLSTLPAVAEGDNDKNDKS